MDICCLSVFMVLVEFDVDDFLYVIILNNSVMMIVIFVIILINFKIFFKLVVKMLFV